MVITLTFFQGACGEGEQDDRSPAGNAASPSPSASPASTGGIDLDSLSQQELFNLRRTLDQEIKNQISNKACSNDSQCRSIAFGEKSCGGPDSYLVYSTQQTDASQVESKVALYNRVDKRWDEVRGGVSDCRFIEEPRVECMASACAGTTNQ
ncbi:MAG: hypothetical protein AB1540_03905 [Bdellovibrionota bacterium]